MACKNDRNTKHGKIRRNKSRIEAVDTRKKYVEKRTLEIEA